MDSKNVVSCHLDIEQVDIDRQVICIPLPTEPLEVSTNRPTPPVDTLYPISQQASHNGMTFYPSFITASKSFSLLTHTLSSLSFLSLLFPYQNKNKPSGKGSKLLRYIEHRLRVTLSDSRTIIGTFLAFDKHLNLVLVDTEEYRTLRSKKGGGAANVVEERQEKRTLGLIILRGENVVSIAVEGPPPSSGGRVNVGGPGVSKGVGRGAAAAVGNNGGGAVPPPAMGAPMGLGAAPVHGVGGMGGMPPGMGRGMPPP
eukprot:scaffold103090_cov24-Cyclotella_meneghiniana.AAC.1